MDDALQCNGGPLGADSFQRAYFESGHSFIITSCLSDKNYSGCVSRLRSSLWRQLLVGYALRELEVKICQGVAQMFTEAGIL